jgi:transcriptional regulator with XRE-family HTH domain
MTFHELERRFAAFLRERVHRGEITERGLARATGVSQPHIHNVLKGKRHLSPDTADEILRYLRLDLLDLIEPGEMLEWTRRRGISRPEFPVSPSRQYAEREQGGDPPAPE